MADKILGGIGIPVVVTRGTEAKLTATPDVYAEQAEIGMSSDSGLAMIRRDDNVPFSLIVEFWRADQTTDAAPSDDTTTKKITLQKLSSPPTNAAYIAFSNNPGTDVFYLVLEDA